MKRQKATARELSTKDTFLLRKTLHFRADTDNVQIHTDGRGTICSPYREIDFTVDFDTLRISNNVGKGLQTRIRSELKRVLQ